MPLSIKDYEQLLELCQELYAMTNRNDLLQVACEWLQHTIRIPTAVLVPANPQTGLFQFEKNFLFHCTANSFTQYLEHYARLDPLATDGWILRFDNSVARYTDYVSQARLAESEYGRDFLSQIPMFYCLCATLGYQGDPVGALGLHRTKNAGDFTARDKALVRHVAPHLSQALHHLHLLDTIASLQNHGLVLLSQDGHALYLNEEARIALDGTPVTELPDPGLGTASAFFCTKGKKYRVRTLRKTSSLDQGFAKLLDLDCSLARRIAKIIVLEPEPPSWTLKDTLRAFDLSPRQQEIAMLTIQGCSNREIADRLFICEQTVKDHLRDVFERMHIRRRSELAAKVLAITPPEIDTPQ